MQCVGCGRHLPPNATDACPYGTGCHRGTEPDALCRCGRVEFSRFCLTVCSKVIRRPAYHRRPITVAQHALLTMGE
jgi:hypothetical protein